MLEGSTKKKTPNERRRERKLRPKPEAIQLKLGPVIFGSIQGSFTWSPWTIRGEGFPGWMDFRKLMKSQKLYAKLFF